MRDSSKTDDSEKYDGVVHKCPNCGETLDSFMDRCPSCGRELRGVRASASVREFSEQYSSADTNEKRAALVRSFPVPNSKEDLLEFMILATSNVDGSYLPPKEEESQDELVSAWLAKAEQAMNKAELVIRDKELLKRLQEIYREKLVKVKRARKRARRSLSIREIMQNEDARTQILSFILIIFIFGFMAVMF